MLPESQLAERLERQADEQRNAVSELSVSFGDRDGNLRITALHRRRILDAADIRVRFLALGGVDLASAAGKPTMYVVNAVAEFECDLLMERTRAGLRRAMSQGRHPVRPHRLSGGNSQSMLELLATGASISSFARKFDTSRQTIMRAKDGDPARRPE